MAKNAIVLRKRGIRHAGKLYRKGKIIENMSDGQFADWQGVGIVGEAPVRAAKPAPKAG